MSRVGASAALTIVMGWVIFAALGWFVSAQVAAGIGLAFGLAAVLFYRKRAPIGALVALLAPFGVMLPALALRHIAEGLGVPMAQFNDWELLVFLVVYVGFLASAFDVIPIDLYRFGYSPISVAAMVLAVCAYAFWMGNPFLAAVAVLGQLAWVLGWGSSNWFDYVLHVLLVPVTVVALILRAV